MSAKRKTIFKGFDYMHCDDFARLLMDMAAKGWHFKEWGVGLKFEKGDPEQAVYAVEVFPKASDNDMRPEPNTEEFAEYCESAGWKFIDAKQKFCIFKKIDEEAVELFTPEERVTNAFKGTVSGTTLLLLFITGLNAYLQWIKLGTSFEHTIFSSAFFFGFAMWNVMFLGEVMRFVYAFSRKHKLRKVIRMGQRVYIGDREDGKYHLGWDDIYMGILIALLLTYFMAMDQVGVVIFNALLVGTTLIFAVLMNKFRPEHDTSVMMQIVFTFVIGFMLLVSVVISLASDGVDDEFLKENLPVQISDYREHEEGIRDISYYHDENIFGSEDRYFIYGEHESIHYYVYRSSYSEILDQVWENIVTDKKYNEDMVDCTNAWGAQKAVRNLIGTYYVRYDDAILEFSDGVDVYLTEEQIDIIRDGLDLR